MKFELKRVIIYLIAFFTMLCLSFSNYAFAQDDLNADDESFTVNINGDEFEVEMPSSWDYEDLDGSYILFPSGNKNDWDMFYVSGFKAEDNNNTNTNTIDVLIENAELLISTESGEWPKSIEDYYIGEYENEYGYWVVKQTYKDGNKQFKNYFYLIDEETVLLISYTWDVNRGAQYDKEFEGVKINGIKIIKESYNKEEQYPSSQKRDSEEKDDFEKDGGLFFLIVIGFCYAIYRIRRSSAIERQNEENKKVATNYYINNELGENSSIMNKVDTMSGQEFEYFCASLLRKNGFNNVEVTKSSGDQGVDIIAIKDDIKYAIQCKCYSSDLGNKPIQEVYAGKRIYNCQVAVVLTNRSFTQGGRDAAESTGVLLWDRNKLKSLIDNAENII